MNWITLVLNIDMLNVSLHALYGFSLELLTLSRLKHAYSYVIICSAIDWIKIIYIYYIYIYILTLLVIIQSKMSDPIGLATLKGRSRIQYMYHLYNKS